MCIADKSKSNKIIIPQFIKELFNKSIRNNGRLNGRYFSKIKTDDVDIFLKKYNLSQSELFYIYKNKLDYIPSCKICGEKLKDFRYKCCKKCRYQNKEVQEKVKKTCLERYGCENPRQNKEVQEKVKKTCLERYGGNSPACSKEIQEKIKQTNLEKYGVDSYTKTESFKNKQKCKCQKKYGVDYFFQTDDYKEKSKNKCQKEYGVDYYTQTKEFKERIKLTNNLKYGGNSPACSKEIQEKIKQTNLEKYGVDNYTKSEAYKIETRKKNRLKFYEINRNNLKRKNIEILSTKNEYINENNIKYLCLLCNNEFYSDSTSFSYVHCPYCTQLNFSYDEKCIYNYINSIYNKTIIENYRTLLYPYELDIYIPEKKLAIEFNGDYWHSTQNKEKYYHQKKTLKCKEKGIRLIHIFEYEWNTKQEICKSIIKSAFGIYDKKIYARKCIVKEISANDYKDFLVVNHLQGSINSSIRYGLYYNDELVSVIGFGKSRFKKDEMELHRFCSKLNYQVIGAFSKLIKHSNITNFITYVDLAHFSGDGYKKIGFKEISITEPNYKWIDRNFKNVLNRFQTQKHNLPKLLGDKFNLKLSEIENMLINGYKQIYDSGNIKMIYTLNNSLDTYMEI